MNDPTLAMNIWTSLGIVAAVASGALLGLFTVVTLWNKCHRGDR